MEEKAGGLSSVTRVWEVIRGVNKKTPGVSREMLKPVHSRQSTVLSKAYHIKVSIFCWGLWTAGRGLNLTASADRPSHRAFHQIHGEFLHAFKVPQGTGLFPVDVAGTARKARNLHHGMGAPGFESQRRCGGTVNHHHPAAPA